MNTAKGDCKACIIDMECWSMGKLSSFMIIQPAGAAGQYMGAHVRESAAVTLNSIFIKTHHRSHAAL